MRRIGFAIALTVLLLASLGSAQQTTNNASSGSDRSGSPTPPPGPILGGMGTANYIAIWADSVFLVDSAIYQASSGNIGIGTTTPAATLDVDGGINTATSYEIGGNAVFSIAGTRNTFLGQSTGSAGTDNVFVGNQAATVASGLQENTIIGSFAGGNITSGAWNTFVGYTAGEDLVRGSNNIYLGSQGNGLVQSESNTIRIGAQGTGDGQQNAVYIAGVFGTTSSSGIEVYVNSNGQLGTTTSSLRFKEQVRDMGDSTSGLMKLRPVTFLYKPEDDKGERTLQYGLIAEEVAKVYPELVAYDNEGQPYSVRYQYLSTMLLNEVQKQYRRAEAEAKLITTQQDQIQALQEQNRQFQERLLRLEKLVPQTVAQK